MRSSDDEQDNSTDTRSPANPTKSTFDTTHLVREASRSESTRQHRLATRRRQDTNSSDGKKLGRGGGRKTAQLHRFGEPGTAVGRVAWKFE